MILLSSLPQDGAAVILEATLKTRLKQGVLKSGLNCWIDYDRLLFFARSVADSFVFLSLVLRMSASGLLGGI